MAPADWIALAGIVATGLVSVASLLIAQRARREQQRREDQIREHERFGVPHIEFRIDCQIHGPVGDSYLAECLLTVCNRGRVRKEFSDIVLRLRGIEQGTPLLDWEGHEPRLCFPLLLLDDVSVKPKRYKDYFVEPGVEQLITYITRIPASTRFLLAHASFRYDGSAKHTTERVFAVRTLRVGLPESTGREVGA